MGNYSEEQGERFHQDMCVFENRYQGHNYSSYEGSGLCKFHCKIFNNPNRFKKLIREKYLLRMILHLPLIALSQTNESFRNPLNSIILVLYESDLLFPDND